MIKIKIHTQEIIIVITIVIINLINALQLFKFFKPAMARSNINNERNNIKFNG